jgi:hypothetical protein
MAVTPSASVKTAIITALRDAVANGTLELQSASSQVLAVFGLNAAAGTVSGSVWTIGFDATTVQGTAAAGTGTTATKARFKDSGGNVDIDGLTVGLTGSGADIQLNNVSISNGQDVELTSAQITYA